MLKIMGKKLFTILCWKFLFILTYGNIVCFIGGFNSYVQQFMINSFF